MTAFFRLQLVGLLFSFSLFSQSFHLKFRHLTISEGLSQSSANAIIQDQQGSIWIGTQDGLNKYNGYQFKIFKHVQGDSTTLRNNFIYSLALDNNQQLWVGTEYGINIVNPETETIRSFDLITDNYTGKKNPLIRSIAVDRRNQVWIAAQTGLFKYDIGSKKLTYFIANPTDSTALNNSYINQIYIDDEENVCLGSFNVISIYKQKEQKFEHYFPHKNLSLPPGNINYTSISHDAAGNIWLGTNVGIIRSSEGFKNSKFYALAKLNIPNEEIRSVLTMYEDKNGTLWAGSSGSGLLRYYREKDEFLAYKTKIRNPSGISHNEIQCIFEDRTQLLWVGTVGGGVNILDTKPAKFQQYFNRDSEDVFGLTGDIWAILLDSNNNRYIGTSSDGVVIMNSKTLAISLLNKKNGCLNTNTSYALAEDKNGNIWIGTDNDLNWYNPNTKETKVYPFPKYPVGIGQRKLFFSKNGTLWIGSFSGLGKFDVQTQTGFFYRSIAGDSQTITSGAVNAFFEDSDGVFWIGTNNGLNILDVKTGLFQRFLSDENDPNTLCYNNIQSLAEDAEGNIWVGTGMGLSVYSKTTKRFQSFYAKDGLINDCIYDMLSDDKGRFWVSTNHGIVCFDPKKLLAAPVKLKSTFFRSYTQDDGLQSNEFNHGAAFKTKNGYMYFGGYNGLNRFNPDQVSDNPYIPKLLISSFKVLDEPVNFYKLYNESENHVISLNSNKNVFSFEFAAMDFTFPPKNQYAYKLDGFDKNWIYSKNRRFVSYTNLDPGDYTFHVKGSNNDGLWNEEGFSVNISIVPPFWKTKSAYVIFGLAFILLVYLFIKWRALILELEKKRLERLVEEKTHELRLSYEQLHKSQEQLIQSEKMRVIGQLASGIAHDINNILSIILGSSELLFSKITDTDIQKRINTISKAATDGASIIKRLQEFSKIDQKVLMQALNLNNLLSEVEDMTGYLIAEKRKMDKVNITFESNFGQIPLINGNISELRSAFTNLLINAVDAFQSDGKITLTTRLLRDIPPTVEIVVADTGKGIPKDLLERIFEPFFTTKGVKGSGLGLSQVYGIFTRHQGTITVDSIVGKGTIFTIHLPFEKDLTLPVDTTEKKEFDGLKLSESAKKKLLLVVEDEEAIRGIYQDIIIEMGLEAVFAITAEEGIEKWHSAHYDLIISDLGLPGKSGWEFIEKVREENSKIPILVITGWGNDMTLTKADEHKVNKLITKPFRFEEITTEIAALVNQS